jgi:hypothetical protein
MKRTLILAAATIILLVLCSAAVIYSQDKKPDLGPQVVLQAYRSELGHVRVVPQSTVIFNLIPSHPESAPAPVPDGTFMICHQYTVHDVNNIVHIAFKCGADEYLLQGIGIKPEKK